MKAAAKTGRETSPTPDPGKLPAWQILDLPAPPPFSARNLMKIIGPGAILLATSIGGGEWLVGPAAAVKYGVTLMWIATVAIALQVVFNLEAIRYTLYTGEPIYGGFLRLKPGPFFWAIIYSIIAILQLGWPALALSSAGSIFSMISGRLPGLEPGDLSGMHWIATGLIVVTFLILMFGGTIERMLEYTSWFMLAYIFIFLMTVNLLFVPAHHWLETLRGFLTIGGGLNRGLDWGLMGALAATAGSGGIGNLTISNWIRDKGFGMGATVGAITSAVGGEKVKLSHVGNIFPITDESLRRWREWLRYIHVDQVWLWGLFCFIGIFLTVNLATGVIPLGTPIDGLATGAYQADYMARHWWRGLWYLTLLNGFWILFSTHLGNTDLLVRTVTDVLWMGSSRVREWKGGRVRVIYYGLLGVFSLWGLVAVRFAGPFTLFKMVANIAGAVLAFAGIQILIVNRRFLPKELRPPAWREALLAICVLFYMFFAVRAVIG